ncbi:MAG: DNA-binding protein [Lactobacillus sp.]|nr:MAG: DNA-binding protein [Lactobacillus sp.]
MDQIKITLTDQQLTQIINGTTKAITKQLSLDVDNYFGQKRYMNKKEACKYLEVSAGTLSKWVSEGLPEIRYGKSVRYDPTDLNNFMNQHKVILQSR